MSENAHSHSGNSIRVLKTLPLLEQCRIAHERVSAFYESIKMSDFDPNDGVSDNKDKVSKILKKQETILVAYARARGKNKLKLEAEMYANRHVLFGNQNPAAPYAHGEIRIRKLEILCMESKGHREPGLEEFTSQLRAKLSKAEKRWRDFYAEHIPVFED